MPEVATDPPPQEGEEEQESKNIWQELLASSTQGGGWATARELSSTLIVLGGKNNGKSSVLNKFTNRITNVNTPEYILDYSYVNVKNKYNLDKDETVSRMNVWQLDDHSHKDLLVNLVEPQSLATSCFMITIDLSQPWDVLTSLTKWLEVSKDISDKLLAKMTEEEAAALRTAVSKYNQFFVDVAAKKAEEAAVADGAAEAALAAPPAEGEEAKEAAEGGEEPETQPADAAAASEITEDDSKEVSVDLAKPEVNLGIPVVIVCNKADYFNRVLAKQGADDRFDLISQQLRNVAIKYGATLVYTSAFGEGINIDLCQDYIFHRLFDFPLKHSAKAVGSAEDVGLYVPAGYDSADLIASGITLKNGWTNETKLEEVFENPAIQKSDKASVSQVLAAASNEDFFKSLKDQLEKGHSGGTATSSAPASTGAVTEQGDEKRNQKAVKSFFKSLLNGPAAGAQRDKAREAMNDMGTT